MSWDNCKKCMFMPRSSYTSALFKVLITLKLLHGSRSGAKGSTLEDIAMHMIKYFCLDGDIKSQVLASLKYGVKMHFIQKKKERFSLILPASSIHLAPCKYKNEEIERIQCLYPPVWDSGTCPDAVCGGRESCCGKRKRTKVCCQNQEDSDDDPHSNSCRICKSKKLKSSCRKKNRCMREESTSSKSSCSQCFPSPRRSASSCARTKPSLCARKHGKCGRSKSNYENYCQLCPPSENESSYKYDAFKNCSCCQK